MVGEVEAEVTVAVVSILEVLEVTVDIFVVVDRIVLVDTSDVLVAITFAELLDVIWELERLVEAAGELVVWLVAADDDETLLKSDFAVDDANKVLVDAVVGKVPVDIAEVNDGDVPIVMIFV